MDELPSDIKGLRRLADRVHHTSRRVHDLVRARTALKKAELLDPDDFGTAWRLGRVNGVLARMDEDNTVAWAREGLAAAALARSARPKRVEGHLYFAISAGMLAKSQPMEADKLMKGIVESATKAIACDPDYEAGEARRVLGAIYLYAPAWPGGVGDLDLAYEVLTDVVKDHPDDPRNLFYLAEAQRRQEERREALDLYKRVLAAPRRGMWALEGPPYRTEARQRVKDLGGR
jgi:tetratricopeptide (TPR) repeat protein